MAKRIITISREFGSGGRFIGEKVAKKLGIAYYDKNIIRIKLQPFRKIEIPKADVPEKRALDIPILQKFFYGAIPETKLKASLPELSRDVAEMVFCLAGMNTADLFELRKESHGGKRTHK